MVLPFLSRAQQTPEGRKLLFTDAGDTGMFRRLICFERLFLNSSIMAPPAGSAKRAAVGNIRLLLDPQVVREKQPG
jgi:hypothetical protein